MKIWKRNAIIAGVLVLVCAGIYLNWLYGVDVPDLTKTLDADKVLGEATLVMNETQDDAITVVSEQNGDESFAQIRLSRQTARDAAVEMLQETIAYAENEDTSTTRAKLDQIIADALSESQIESMVIAKGYADCVAYIADGMVSLAVASPVDGLTQMDVSLLADIIMAQTDYELSQIRIFGV